MHQTRDAHAAWTTHMSCTHANVICAINIALKTCQWRASMKTFLNGCNIRQPSAAYLKLWRKVQQYRKFKTAPPTLVWLVPAGSQQPLSKTRPGAKLSRQSLSVTTSPMGITVLNVGKSIGRTQICSDGLVHTLGHGCSSFYFPGAGTYITTSQFLPWHVCTLRSNRGTSTMQPLWALTWTS